MGLPVLPCCPWAGARPPPEISPGAIERERRERESAPEPGLRELNPAPLGCGVGIRGAPNSASKSLHALKTQRGPNNHRKAGAATGSSVPQFLTGSSATKAVRNNTTAVCTDPRAVVSAGHPGPSRTLGGASGASGSPAHAQASESGGAPSGARVWTWVCCASIAPKGREPL